MKRIFALGTILAFGLLSVGTVAADDAADVKALVEEGVTLVKEKGRDEALKVIGDPKSRFVKGDLYVFAGSLEKVVLLAHPFAAQLVGEDLSTFKDPKGTLFFVKFKEVAESSGNGWVEYVSPIPGAKEGSLKKAFIMRVPGEKIYVGAAYYPK
jgi:cytochrome c